MSKALFIVDVQNDFTEGGALGVEGGDAVAAAHHASTSVTHAEEYAVIVASRDWHDGEGDNGGHFSPEPDFVDTWPVHCVSGTEGAEYDPGLDTSAVTHHVKKGQGKPAYSLFEGTTDDGVTVAHLLEEHGVMDVDVVGHRDGLLRARVRARCHRARPARAGAHRPRRRSRCGVERRRARRARPRGGGTAPSPVSTAVTDPPGADGRGRPRGARGRGIRSTNGRRSEAHDRRRAPRSSACAWARSSTSPRRMRGCRCAEVDRLLDSDVYEVRVVAVSILDFKARCEGCRRRPQAAVRPLDAAPRPHRHVGLHRPLGAARGRRGICSTSRATCCSTSLGRTTGGAGARRSRRRSGSSAPATWTTRSRCARCSPRIPSTWCRRTWAWRCARSAGSIRPTRGVPRRRGDDLSATRGEPRARPRVRPRT